MSGVRAQSVSLDAGGGPYVLPELTVGVFRNDQPTHRLAVGSDRQQHIPLTSRQGWILPPGAEGLCEYDSPLDVTTVALPADLLRDVGLDTDPGSIEPIVGKLDPLVVEMAIQAEGFASGGAIYAQTMAHAFAAQLLRTLPASESERVDIDDKRLRRAVEYIRTHLADDLSITEIARVATMSPSHFTRAFAKATGASPLQFVIAERLETSMVLLKTTRLPIAEVAFRVGYGDLSRFRQHFRRRYGQTPAAVREA